MKWFLWISVVLLLLCLAGGAAWWYQGGIWSACAGQVKKRVAVLGQQDRGRPVLWGERLEGEAFADYQRALRCVSDPSLWNDLKRQLDGAAEGSASGDRSLARGETGGETSGEFGDEVRDEARARLVARGRLLDATREALGHLRRGAHRHLGARSVDTWAREPDVLSMLALGRVVELHAADHLRRGNAAEAVRVLLDGMQCAGDFGSDPLPVAALISANLRLGPLTALFFECRWVETRGPEFRLGTLPRSACAALLAGLETLPRGLTSLSAQAEKFYLCSVLQYEARGGAAFRASLPDGFFWDRALETKGLVAKVLRSEWARTLDLPDALLPWPKTQSRIRRIGPRGTDPLSRALTVDWLRVATEMRRVRAWSALVERALAESLGRPEAVADPFAARAPLRRREKGGLVRYWSVGPDGQDHGENPELDMVLGCPR